jgi:eukaryotic-like serine/threonine-protein kinase
MLLSPGTHLGPYEITAPLGAGGMGEVYRARDTRLERTVAIKILPAQLSSDPVRKQRFEREAKTISSLNHPHICVLYDVGSQDGVDYLVMECVEGETLAKRLEKGALPLEQVLKYGTQIADALDKAHRSGVIHRDLKPGNIMLMPTGAKLLDFGLARPPMPTASLATLTAEAPRHSPLTQEGTIVGTFQYMSPEQVEGKELDARSDIFSLGAVLYEMLTGKRAFEGKSQLSVATAILDKEPTPISSVKPLTPANLDHAIRRCLAKDLEDRWQTARDLAVELKWIGDSGSQVAIQAIRPEAQKPPGWLPWALCGVLAAGLAAGAVWWRSSRSVEHTMYFSATFSFPVRDMAIAPNGHTVAVVGERESGGKSALWLYEVGWRDAKSVANTDGASFPFWSPDGQSLGFFADGKLKRLDIAAGTVQTLCDAPSGRGGSWNREGIILFTPSGQLGDVVNRIPASGGTPKRISTLDASRSETSHRWPMFLPDGKHYLFMAFNVSKQAGTDAIYVGSLDSNEKKLLTRATANPAYAAPGYLLFYRDKTLFAQHFDLSKLTLTGEASPILTDIQYVPRIARAAFSVFNDSVLVAQSGAAVSLSLLEWFDRSGKEVGAVGEPDVYGNVALAPNGKSVAFDKDAVNQNADVWIYDLQGKNSKRMTFDPAIDAMPVWSPDGTRVVFSSSRKQTFDLYLKNTDGAQEERAIEATPGEDKIPSAWSRDGKYILYTRGTELWFLTYPELRSQLFLKGPSALKNGQFSPDGKRVAYASNESGKWEIYVTSFPGAHGKWQVSNGGGDQPRWRGDGKELFYLAADGKIVAVAVKEGESFNPGASAALFQANPREPVATSEQVMYDVTQDGRRFLINTYVKNREMQPMSVVLNWDVESKKK